MKSFGAQRTVNGSFVMVYLVLSAAFVLPLIGLSLWPVHSQSQEASPTFTFTVTTTADEDGVCDASCSLREAITAANANPGADTINFNITSGTAPFVIQPTSALPDITQAVTIDGYTQPGASSNTSPVGSDANILIVLNGSLAGPFAIGLVIDGAGTTVKGLKMLNWSLGVFTRSPGNIIEGNHIRAARSAVSLESGNNTVGGTTAAARNVLTTSSANDFIINVSGFGSNNNTIRGNYVGTTPDGMSDDTVGLGGINLRAGSHTIIGNVIAGSSTTSTSDGHGIRVNTPGNTIQGNLIGVKADGTGSLPNQRDGIELRAPFNVVGGPNPSEGNIIANSGRDGIFVLAAGNRISGNSIFLNSGSGIDLSPDGVAINDGCDADAGANNLQNFPLIGTADSNGGVTTIVGVLNSTANEIFTIEFFSNDACEISGYGEGKTYLGSTLVATDASCNANFNSTFPVDLLSSQFITATATNNTTGDTSEFSLCKQVNSPPTLFVDLNLTKTDSPDPVAVNNTLTYSLNVTNQSENTADDVVVTDNLPGSVTFISASALCSRSGGTVTCNFGSIAGGASVGASIVVTPTVLGNLTNTATVTTSDIDTNTNNNTDSETTAVSPPLSANLIDAPDPIEAGSDLTYSISVTNHGAAAGNNVQVTDPLPASATFISASANCNHSTGTVTCDLGTLNGGASAAVEIVVRPNQSGTLTNSIEVSSANLGVASASTSTSVYPDIPSTANYIFSTAVNGSLTDMSDAQPIILSTGPRVSSVNPIGFEFFFMGAPTPARFTSFSVNLNGVVRLGAQVTEGTTLGSPNVIFPFGQPQQTGAGGVVSYKTTGSAPNRVLTVEWLNMDSSVSSGGGSTADLTYQLRLHETSGIIEFVYGSMTQTSSGSSTWIGFSSVNALGSTGTVVAAQSGNPPPSYSGAGNTIANSYSVGPITVLNSVANGSRRVFTFTPPMPAAPTDLTFSNVTYNSMTLNWTDNSTDENGFAIYGSLDGADFSFIRTVGRNTVSTSISALQAQTNYVFRVHALSEGGVSAPAQAGQTTSTPTHGSAVSTATGGNWNSPSTWAGGVMPTANDNVTIAAGATVFINIASPAANDLTVDGTLEFTAGLTVTNMNVQSIMITAGGIFRSASTGSVIHTLNVGGSLTNNGTLDFSTSADTSGVNLVFNGSGDSVFAGAGAVTDVRQITVNKLVFGLRRTLELNTANFTVRGATTDVAGFLTLTNGTFKLSGMFAGTNRLFLASGVSIIGANSGLWLNNPNYIVNHATGFAIHGLLRITAGTLNETFYNPDTGGSQRSITLYTGSQTIIEGGTINVAEYFGATDFSSHVSYTQTGGIMTVATQTPTNGGFVIYKGSFTMSGGYIVLQDGCNLNVQQCFGKIFTNTARIQNITGGTVQLGNSLSGVAKFYHILGTLPNLVISNETAGHQAWVASVLNFDPAFTVRGVTVTLNTTINPGTTLLAGGWEARFRQVGPLLTNNGSIFVFDNPADTGSNFLFEGTTPQSYTGSGIAGSVASPLSAFDINNPNGATIDPTSPTIITKMVRLKSGTYTNSNKIQIGTGGTSSATIERGNRLAQTAPAGAFDTAPVFNIGSGGLSLHYLNAGGATTTGAEIPSTRTVRQLRIDNAGGVNLDGGDLTLDGPAAARGGSLSRTPTGTASYNQDSNGQVAPFSNFNKDLTGANIGSSGTFPRVGHVVPGNTITFDGTAAQNAQVFPSNNMTINDPAGVNMVVDEALPGLLTFANGEFNTGANTLTVGTGVTSTRTGGHLVGSMRKQFDAPGAFTYHVGTAGAYSPLSQTVTAMTAPTGELTVRPNTGMPVVAPVPLDSARTLQRYWTLSGNGIRSNLTFQYQQPDVPATTNEALWQVIRVTGNTVVRTPPGPDVIIDGTANTFTVNNVEAYSDWTAGAPLAPTAAHATVSGRVTDSLGNGISGVRILMQDQAGNVVAAITNPFGFYTFTDVQAGQTYVLSPTHKRYAFQPRTINVLDDLTGVDFSSEP